MKKQNSSRDAAIALLLSGLFVLIVALISMNPKQEKAVDLTAPAGEDVRPIDLVNKHLREIYDRQEIDRINAENMNLITAPSLHTSPPVEPVFHFDQMPISFDQDSLEEVVGQDLRIYASSQARQKTLNEQIQQEIIDDIKKSAEEEVYQKALADSIIKKARSQGFDVQVDENFKIKSVRKIVIKEAPSLFDPNNLPNR